jgi:hypothetical protein
MLHGDLLHRLERSRIAGRQEGRFDWPYQPHSLASGLAWHESSLGSIDFHPFLSNLCAASARHLTDDIRSPSVCDPKHLLLDHPPILWSAPRMDRDLEDLRSSEPTQEPIERNEEAFLAAIRKDINSKPPPTSPRDVRLPSSRNPTWRVRGVPSDFDSRQLAYVLQHHLDLQVVVAANDINHHSGLEVHTIARDIYLDQVATVRFRNLPTQLATLEQGDQLPIDIPTSPENIHDLVERRHSLQVVGLAIDRHFDDITVLFAPSADKHDIDILAVSGLGGHAFGSFVRKDHGHMWLSDSLPRDMPTARVMIYGYESRLQDSTSFANLDDLASSLQIAICRVLRSEGKHLVLIGHSLGGLLIKEALIRIAESDSDSDLLGLVFGALFFGVPNDGMDIESLIPMVNNQPNRFLLESLYNVNPQILTLQNRNFSRVLKQTNFEIFCFYETRQSPTAVKVHVSRFRCKRTNA